jgi:hypothetical protein
MAMPRPKTHFEQVPLELVKKIVEEKIQAEKNGKRSKPGKPKKRERDLFGASSSNVKVEQS